MRECIGLVIVLKNVSFSLTKVVLSVHDVEVADGGMYKCMARIRQRHELLGKTTLVVEGRATASAH